MKKLFTLCIFTLFAIACSSQNWWVDIGAKGAYNSTWLLNSNYSKDKNMAYDLSFGYGYGAKLGFNFNDESEITVDFLFSTVNQKLHSTGLTDKYTADITMRYLDIPLLYRNNKNGTYIEIGPQYSMLLGGSVSESLNGIEASSGKEVFAPKNLSAVFGFGSYLFGSENLYVCLGMRFAYGFLDINSDDKKGKDYHFIDPKVTETAKYSSTNLLYGGFVLELNFDLGYMVSSTCGKRRVLFF